MVISLDKFCCTCCIEGPHDLFNEGLWSQVIATNSLVHLLQDILGFFLFDMPQVRLGKSSLVKLVIQHRESGSLFLDLLGLLRIRW